MPTFLLGALMTAALVAQTPATGNPPIRLSGCVGRDVTTPGHFTLADSQTGSKYRLSGKGLGKYLNQRVEIVGKAQGSRLTVRGGLTPSPNTAAQAGAIDPTKAAVASMPGGADSGTGAAALPEFKVTRVQPLTRSCR